MFDSRGESNMNKKGGEKYLSIWWYLCLIFVLAGVVVSVWKFQVVTDVSYIDAGILANRVLDCLVRDGKITREMSNFNIDSFLEECKIKLRDGEQGKDYFIGIEVYDAEKDCTESNGEWNCMLKEGNGFYKSSKFMAGDLKERCLTLEGLKTTYMPECSYKEIYAFSGERKVFLKIIGGTNER